MQGIEELIGVALALGAADCGGPLSPEEQTLCASVSAKSIPEHLVRQYRNAIVSGDDPLGEAYLRATVRPVRHARGMVYTPLSIVKAMVTWVAEHKPQRVVDMGCGSGRFIGEAARQLPRAELVAVDIDPVATLLTRARLVVLGARRCHVIQGDYLDLSLDPMDGVTAFIGNPPYVRHHKLTRAQKDKAQAIAQQLGLSLSGLSGLHAHFLLATALKACPGDVGCVIVSAEWMQVGYGQPLRDLLAGFLGLEVLHLLDPEAMAFPGVLTTSAILAFRVGSSRQKVLVTPHAKPETLGHFNGYTVQVDRARLLHTRWGDSVLSQESRHNPGTGENWITLGSLARVHRGIATGANDFFVMTPEQARERGLTLWVRPVLTKAVEVLESDGVARVQPDTSLLLCPPADIDLAAPEQAPLREYLGWGERREIHLRYLCAHRRPWWYLGPLKPPPIVATYMARRPPAFALNPDGMLILNVLHGIYPVRPMTQEQLAALVCKLNVYRNELKGQGRTYQGGLEKFEPREFEAIRLPFRLPLHSYAAVDT